MKGGQRPKVVVIGAGFGGIGAGTRLAHLPVDATIVDRRNHHVFQPLLYQVATAGLNPSDIALAVRAIFQDDDNVDFRLGDVEHIDVDQQLVHVDVGEPLPYDYLIISAGSETRWFGIPGVEEHALPLKTVEDAIRLRGHVLAQFERAAADPQLIDEGALTFVVVGGGPTGVEVSGALIELFHVLQRDFHHLDVSRARVVLVEATDHLLNGFTERSQQSAVDTLEDRGVEVRLNQSVDRAGPGRVHFKDGEVLATGSLIWAAGVEPAPLTGQLPFERGRGGRIVVGGGPTGVEVSGALIELFHVLQRDFHHLDVTRARVVLVEATDHLLNGFTERSQQSAVDTLEDRGVEVRLNQSVDRAGPGRVHFKDGEVLATGSLIWAAGVEPAPLTGQLPFERGRGGRIVVGPDLRPPGHDNVFVIGDMAAATDHKGRPYTQMASVALQQGHFAGRQVGRLVRGRRPRRFRYIDYGYMATIGRNSAVAELAFHIRLRGFFGWAAWLTVHLVRLMGFRNRLSVFFNWAWNYVTYDRAARIIVLDEDRGSRRAPASDTGTRPRP